MLIKQVYFEDEDCFRNGYKITVETYHEESMEVSFLDGEPEDSSLSRDFSGVYSISDLIEMAYYAGIAGEEIEFSSRETSDIDEF